MTSPLKTQCCGVCRKAHGDGDVSHTWCIDTSCPCHQKSVEEIAETLQVLLEIAEGKRRLDVWNIHAAILLEQVNEALAQRESAVREQAIAIIQREIDSTTNGEVLSYLERALERLQALTPKP